MPKAYEAKTITEFGGLHNPGTATGSSAVYRDNADLQDNEAALMLNFVFNDVGGISKRHGFITYNSNVQATATSPVGQTLVHPANIWPLAIQRRSVAFNDLLFFTSSAQANIWRLELTSVTNTFCVRVLMPSNTAINNVEWMIPAGTPTEPYQMMICRRAGNMHFIDGNGIAGAPLSSSPPATHITLFKDRIFSVDSSASNGDEHKVKFSQPTDYGNFPANNYFSLGLQGGDYLVATCVFNDQLIIFKSRSIWTLSADGLPTSWSWRNLHASLGCAGRGSIQIIGGMIYFLGTDGVYRTDGTSFERISDPVHIPSAFTVTANPASTNEIQAFYYDNKYILFSRGVNSQYVYDIPREAWSYWSPSGSVTVGGGVPYIDTATHRLYVGDNSANRIYVMTEDEMSEAAPWQDNGANYDCVWQSKRLTWDDANNYRRNYAFTADIGFTQGAAGNVVVQHTIDPFRDEFAGNNFNKFVVPPLGAATLSNSQARRLIKVQGAGYTRGLDTQITYTAPTSFTLYSVTWLNQVKDVVKWSN